MCGRQVPRHHLEREVADAESGANAERLRVQWLERVFSHGQASSWESVVTSVRSKASAVAARKMSPRSDWGSSIFAASAATAKVNGASRSGTWAITSSSHCAKPCRTRRRFRRTRWCASQIDTGDRYSSLLARWSSRRTLLPSFSGLWRAQIQMCVSSSNLISELSSG